MAQPKTLDKSIYRFIDSQVTNAPGSTFTQQYMDDPTVMGFNLVINFNSKYNPLFYMESDAPSAFQYLLSIGEKDKADKLKDFINRFKDIIYKYPYYLQTLQGLKNIYKYDPKNGWTAFDSTLTIKTLESIDLRIGNLLQKYFEASFDIDYNREIIPENLRRFDCMIVVSEIRNFKTFVKAASGEQFQYKIQRLNDQLNCYIYSFKLCELILDDSNEWMNEISNAGESSGIISNSFKIKVGYFEEKHKMDFLGIIEDGSKDVFSKYRNAIYGLPSDRDLGTIGGAKSLEDQIPKRKGGALNTMIDALKSTPEYDILSKQLDPKLLDDRIKNLAINELQNLAEKVILGNVFDVQHQVQNFNPSSFLSNQLDKVLDRNTKLNPAPEARGNVFPADEEKHIKQPENLGTLQLKTTSTLRETINNTLGDVLDTKPTDRLFPTYLGNVFDIGHSPISGTLNMLTKVGVQGLTNNNNTII